MRTLFDEDGIFYNEGHPWKDLDRKTIGNLNAGTTYPLMLINAFRAEVDGVLELSLPGMKPMSLTRSRAEGKGNLVAIFMNDVSILISDELLVGMRVGPRNSIY